MGNPVATKTETGPRVHPIVPALACFAAVASIYHIFDGATLAGDAARALLAGVAASACLAFAAKTGVGRSHAPAKPPSLPLVALVLLSGIACVGTVALTRGVPARAEVPAATLAVLAGSCLGTAVWEEVLFRRLLPDGIAHALGDKADTGFLAAVVSAGVFAFLHLGVSGIAESFRGLLELVVHGSPGAEAGDHNFGYLLQALLFSLTMSGIVQGRRGLAAAVALHAVYDLVCFWADVHLAASTLPAGAAGASAALGLATSALLPACAAAAVLLFGIPAILDAFGVSSQKRASRED